MIQTHAERTVESFNALPDDEAAELLATCLGVERWVTTMLAGRPYRDVDAVVAGAEATVATLTPDEIETALTRHPRIGERAGRGHDAAFSAAEQSGVDATEASVAAALADGNAAYEQRFGRVFLIRAAGRSSDDILAHLRRRLGNTDVEEVAEVRSELGEIAVLRLRQLVAP